jgi:hypothetical protein
MKKNILFASLILSLIPFMAHAQMAALDASDLTVITTPQYPEPNSVVTLKLQDYAIDLNSSTITWTVNGKQAQSAMGATSLTLETGKPGTVSNVSVSVTPQGAARIQKTLTINPTSIDLVWEANTSVPPFYKGKALPASQSTIKVVALPHVFQNGKEIPTNKLVYAWTVNDDLMQSSSGFAKNVLMYAKDLIKTTDEISVKISSIDGNISVEKKLSLGQVQPEIHFYEQGPLTGVLYNTEINGGATLLEQEASIRAEPYYFSREDFTASTLELSWMINGSPAPASNNPFVLTVRTDGKTAGTFPLECSITNNAKILQSAESSIAITTQTK